MRVALRAGLAVGLVCAWAHGATAEPKFLAKQYTRCTTCHVSPTGGGLLSAYGRSLSHRELSTTGAPMPSHGDMEPKPGEESFLWGAFGESLGPVQLGIEMRPSYLHYSFAGISQDRNLLMNADVLASYKAKDWLFYGQIGRELELDGHTLDSSEYWGGYQPTEGLGFRAGRFLPAYGVRFADHTSFNRSISGPGPVRPDLRARGQPHARPLSDAGVVWSRPCRVGDRRRRALGVHGDRTRAGRSGIADGGGGLGPLSRRVGHRSAAGVCRCGVWLRADLAHHELDSGGRAVPRRRHRHVVRAGQRDLARGLPRHLAYGDAAGPRRWRRGGARPAALRRRHGHPAAHALQREHRTTTGSATAPRTSRRRSSWRSCTCICSAGC